MVPSAFQCPPYLFQIYLKVKRDGKWVEEEKLNLPLPCFQPGRGLFLCAKITKYDRETGRYELEYSHGPYLPYETPSNKKRLGVKKFPQAVTRFVIDGVDPHLISVDPTMRNSMSGPDHVASTTQTASYYRGGARLYTIVRPTLITLACRAASNPPTRAA